VEKPPSYLNYDLIHITKVHRPQSRVSSHQELANVNAVSYLGNNFSTEKKVNFFKRDDHNQYRGVLLPLLNCPLLCLRRRSFFLAVGKHFTFHPKGFLRSNQRQQLTALKPEAPHKSNIFDASGFFGAPSNLNDW